MVRKPPHVRCGSGGHAHYSTWITRRTLPGGPPRVFCAFPDNDGDLGTLGRRRDLEPDQRSTGGDQTTAHDFYRRRIEEQETYLPDLHYTAGARAMLEV
jgi:hypothetical protein